MIDFFKILEWSGFPVAEARVVYDSIKNTSDFVSWQEQQLYEIWNFHLENNKFYRGFVQGKTRCWEELPIITKCDLQGDYLQKMPSIKQKYYVAKTSGSSGIPFIFAKDKLTHALVWINEFEHYGKCGIRVNDLQARFYGIPLKGIEHYKEVLKDILSVRVRFPVFDLSDAVLEKWLTRFRKANFAYVYGYTSSIVVFAHYLQEKGLVLKLVCPTLKACIVTAEMCTNEDKAIIESGFGVPVSNEYGASEVSVIGFKQHDYWNVSDEIVYVEVVDDDGRLVPDDTKGRLLVTLLHNKGTPIIRYDTGDMASIRRINGKTLITSLVGRSSDTVVLPSGRKVPGLTFYYVARELLEKCREIREFRVVQTGARDFVVEIVAPGVLADTRILEQLKSGFDEYLEKGLNISMSRVNSITRSGSGKLKHFIPFK